MGARGRNPARLSVRQAGIKTVELGALDQRGEGGVAPAAGERSGSAAFELGDEENLAARPHRLEIGGLVMDRAVDRDGGFFDEMLAEPGIEPVERLQDVAHRLRLDVE